MEKIAEIQKKRIYEHKMNIKNTNLLNAVDIYRNKVNPIFDLQNEHLLNAKAT